MIYYLYMEKPYSEKLKEGHITPQEGEDPEKIKKGDETLQKEREKKNLKEKLEGIIKKLKRETGENLEDVEIK